MARMLASQKNRAIQGVDDPYNSDGFYLHRRFKAKRKGGAPTGGRAWRRVLRAKEGRSVRREVQQELS